MSDIEVSRQPGQIEIQFNRPDKKNAITGAMYQAMADAMAEAEADPSVQVVLFHGAGDNYTAGNDLGDFIANPPRGADSPVGNFLQALLRARKILIAAIHGNVVGVGTTMLLHCDLVIAAPTARLSFPFAKLGLIPEAGSSLLLPRLVGHQKALELMLLGEPFSAETAQALGLINRIVAEGEALATARQLAGTVISLPPEAALQTKALIRRTSTGSTDTLAERLAEESVLFTERLASGEFREAATAFFEKRPADFSKFRKG